VKRLALILALAAPALAAAVDPIPWTDAASCVGRVCSISGTVVDVEDDGTAIRLYFDKENHDVCVTLVRSWLVSWPDYAGRSLVANGLVRRFREVTEVTVHGVDEITLADAGPTPAVEFESPEKQELRELREEMERMKKRMKELESR
jgi:hypothetical protein